MSRAARMRPTPAHDLLLRAALHPDRDTAVAAYARWSARIDLDRADLGTVRMLPLLKAREDPLPPEPRLDHQIANIVRFMWLQSQVLTARAAPVLTRLAADGVDVTLLKGAALVHGHGIDPRARTMSDLDLLVAPQEIEAAAAALAACGFSSRIDDVLAAHAGLVRERLHAIEFLDGHGGRIDLHWHALHDARHPEVDAGMAETRTPASLGGVPCSAAGAEATIVLAIAHGTRWARSAAVRWVGDVALLVRAREDAIDWDRVVALSRLARLAAPVHDALDYLDDVSGVQAPRESLRALARTPVPVAVRLRRRRGDGEDGGPRPPGRVGLLADAYEDATASTVVPAGARTGPRELTRFLARRWALGRATQVPGHAAWVVAGRPERGAARHLRRPPSPDWWPRYPLGSPLAFTEGYDSFRYLGAGWWFPEDHGTWSSTTEARIVLPLDGPPPGVPLGFELEVSGLLGPQLPVQPLDVFVGGTRLLRCSLREPGGYRLLTASVPVHAIPASGELVVTLVSRPVAPADHRLGSDTRQLGVAVRSLRVG